MRRLAQAIPLLVVPMAVMLMFGLLACGHSASGHSSSGFQIPGTAPPGQASNGHAKTGLPRSPDADLAGGPISPERQRSFTALACGRPLQQGEAGIVGCPVCPRDSDVGADATTAGKNPAWTYSSMIFGHFTSAAAAEALLRIDGCESHANGFGGNFLLRRQGANWNVVRYIQGGLASDQCQRLHWSGGRDALVCEIGDMHQGIAEDTVLLLTVEPEPPQQPSDGQGSQFIYATSDDGDCETERGVRAYQVENTKKVNILPAAADGRQDIEILASAGKIKARAKDDQCPAMPEKPYRLLFHNKGDHFLAGPGVARWHTLDPDNPAVRNTITPMRY